VDDPIRSFEIIAGELKAFSESLMRKPMIVVATKLDATTDTTRLDMLRSFCKEHGLEFHAISAAVGDGVKDLVRSIADALDKIPKPVYDASLDLPLDGHEDDSDSGESVTAEENS